MAAVPPIDHNVSDPEEDDLDDLDDMLDEFTPSTAINKQESATTKPQDTTKTLPTQNEEDDFAKQLQAGMAEMLGGLDKDPNMKAQFEAMMKELGGMEGLEDLASAVAPSTTKPAAPSSTTKAASTTSAPTSAANEESFQDTIKKTMERMQASGDKATAAATENDGDDMLAELMKQMGSGALGGQGGDEDFSKMLLSMMEQLTNKEILYEPMKELDDKFPEWIKANKDKTPEEDLARYEEQRKVVREIVQKFEEKTYKDENTADREYIVDRMQRMQAAGSPPADLVGDMAAAQEAFGAPAGGVGKMDDDCAQQ